MFEIFDAHMHCEVEGGSPEEQIEKMRKIGVFGGSVMSPEPESPVEPGYSYEDRMAALDKWTSFAPDKFYKVLWIHPLEKDPIAKMRDAVDRGVSAFKMICDCYYPAGPEAMPLLEEMVRLNKPVIFHSGISWTGKDSSKYNRPLNWEPLVELEGIRFSLAHCSWPWYDETIALYGKFLNATASNPNGPEMFVDTTPGTPKIYRKDLLFKLYNCCYDIPHNIMFGVDCTINNYNAPWTKQWVDYDTELMDEIGVGKHLQRMYFHDNFLRFIGETPKDFTHVKPVPDDPGAFSLEYANKYLK